MLVVWRVTCDDEISQYISILFIIKIAILDTLVFWRVTCGGEIIQCIRIYYFIIINAIFDK